MDQRLIPYRTRPEQARRQRQARRGRLRELHRTSPEGVSDATFRLEDQVTFVHMVQARTEPSPLLAVRPSVSSRPVSSALSIPGPSPTTSPEVGSYRFFAG